MSDSSRAFPCPLPTHPYFLSMGLTKRELFAAMALQGVAGGLQIDTPADIAHKSVEYADALIAELAK